MGQLRRNLLNGRWVNIALERAARPADLAARALPIETGPARPCPFCPGNEESTPPALEVYGKAGQWLVRVVPNLYPAFSGSAPMTVVELGPVWQQAPASGLHEVLVLSPAHGRDLPDFDDHQAGLVMAAVRDRLEDHGRQAAIRYTQVLVNHGREAGASLEHPHGQLLGMPFVPGEIVEEIDGFDRFTGGPCVLCTTWMTEIQAGHRVVFADERVAVFCPFWSGSPYEMLIVPKSHEPHIPRSAPQDVAAVGRALRTSLDRLRRGVGDPAYNLIFHTAPHHEAHTGFHWHVHVLPRITSVAGFEQGTGVLINIVPPELAAQRLTAVDGQSLVISVKPRLRNGGNVLWAQVAAAQPGSQRYNEIVSWARRVRDFGAPIYVTLNHEPEAAANTDLGNASDYLSAWCNWVTIFRQEGATNAKFMWIMTDQSFWLAASDRRAAARWYPGDEWVDGIAGDAYNWFTCRTGINTAWKPLRDIIDPQRRFWLNHTNEELWLTEYGTVEDPAVPGRKAQWLRERRRCSRRRSSPSSTA